MRPQPHILYAHCLQFRKLGKQGMVHLLKLAFLKGDATWENQMGAYFSGSFLKFVFAKGQ